MYMTQIKIVDKDIKIVNNFYSAKADKELLYLTACMSPYTIKGKPAEDVQNRFNLRMEAELDPTTLHKINLFEGDRGNFFNTELNTSEYEIYRAYINLGLVSDFQEIHVDNYQKNIGKTLLIYCNRVWEDNWGGETYFYSDDTKSIEHVSKFEPGKAVLFDSSIPHMANIQHNFCNNYRFTLAIKFVKRNLKT